MKAVQPIAPHDGAALVVLGANQPEIAVRMIGGGV